MGKKILVRVMNGEVYGYHYQPHLLPKEEQENGIYIDEADMPVMPTPKRGKAARVKLVGSPMKITSTTGDYLMLAKADLQVEEVDRPLPQEESLESLVEKLDILIALQQETVALLKQPTF
jgi:hypothetical protein